MTEKRTSERERISKAGKISFGYKAIDCKVRNISAKGARLEVESTLGIPDTFRLEIVSTHSLRQCRVVWRKKTLIGVEFDGPRH